MYTEAAGRPAASRPAADRPTAGRPAAGRPAAGRPAAGRPAAGEKHPQPRLQPHGRGTEVVQNSDDDGVFQPPRTTMVLRFRRRPLSK